MQKRQFLLMFLFILWGIHPTPCQGTAGTDIKLSQRIVDFINTNKKDKKYILGIIKGIEKNPEMVKEILTSGLTSEAQFDSKYQLIEYLLLRLPRLLPESNVNVSFDDLLEISLALWNLDPTTAASVKGVVQNRSAADYYHLNINNAPLIHKLVCEYITLNTDESPSDRSKKQTEILKKFIDFIIEKHPQTLSVKNDLGNTVLHMLHLHSDVIQDTPLTKKLITDLITADESIKPVKLLVNAQNKNG